MKITLRLIGAFLRGDKIIKSEELYLNSSAIHYYTEIIRNWSNLNFVVKKTLRSLNYSRKPNRFEMAKFLYITYRILQEKSLITDIVKELPLSKDFIHFTKRLSTFSWEEALKGKSEEEILSIRESIPTFVIQHLKPVMRSDFLKETLNSMKYVGVNNRSHFKINYLLGNHIPIELKRQIIQDIRVLGINFDEDNNLPDLYHLPSKEKKKVIELEWYKKGFILFQDKGSFAVASILNPQNSERILDMCAAPGIKTTLIAQLSNNRARIIASDFNVRRLIQSIKIFKRLSVSNFFILNSDSINIPLRFLEYFDKVLIDAPCTGSGTFLAHPELIWRQNEDFLRQNSLLQTKLINKGISLLKPNGTLVYSTCSLYPEEGELQVLNCLAGMEPLELPKWFSPSYTINNLELKGTGRLFPSIHNTQGFFIAKFKKKEK